MYDPISREEFISFMRDTAKTEYNVDLSEEELSEFWDVCYHPCLPYMFMRMLRHLAKIILVKKKNLIT